MFYTGTLKGMRQAIFLLTLFLAPNLTLGSVASTQYVTEVTSSKLDTSSTANQTMAGTYTVSGTLIVPTPPLPSAE